MSWLPGRLRAIASPVACVPVAEGARSSRLRTLAGWEQPRLPAGCSQRDQRCAQRFGATRWASLCEQQTGQIQAENRSPTPMVDERCRQPRRRQAARANRRHAPRLASSAAPSAGASFRAFEPKDQSQPDSLASGCAETRRRWRFETGHGSRQRGPPSIAAAAANDRHVNGDRRRSGPGHGLADCAPLPAMAREHEIEASRHLTQKKGGRRGHQVHG